MSDSKIQINLNDFNLFYDTVKTLSKMSNGIKFSVNNCGLTVYAKNDHSKCELTSNAITTDSEISFCIGDIGMMLKILTTVKTIYEGDFSGVRLYFDTPFIRIESKKFKTKISTAEEDTIMDSVGNKVRTQLTPQMEFTTSSNLIKAINSHSFIFSDPTAARIYIDTDAEMENNMVFAKLGNEENDLANSIKMELGMLNYGSIGERKIIIKFDRLNTLNIVPSEEIKVQLAKERPVLMSTIRKDGVNGTFFNLNMYIFLLVR